MNSSSHRRDVIELNTQREIIHLQVAMYYFGYCIKALLIRSQPYLHCQSFMALNGANFSGVEIGFFSVAKVPVKHSSLYRKINFKMLMFLLSFQTIVVGIFTS